MNKALELYIYMGSVDQVIKELEGMGIKTKDAATTVLGPYCRGLVMQSVMTPGSSLAGTARTAQKVLEHFEKLEKSGK